MPIEYVPGTALTYHLIAFDPDGRELVTGPDGPASRAAAAALAGGAVTDVFVFAHGWLGDLPAARHRSGAWVAALRRSRADVDLLGRCRPGFRPLFVGLYWPSRPWDDEELGPAGTATATPAPAPALARAYTDAVARAGRLGEGGGRRLLATLQAAAPAGTGFHLMGHGFGCVAVSAMLTGDQPGPVAPVRSLVLVQGTLSAFAFCARDPAGPGRPGRYHRALDPAAVTGPAVVTRSGHDRVTGWLHPLAAQSGADDGPARTAQSGAASGSGSDGGPVLGGLPRNAALGTLGARGLGGRSVDLDAGPAGAGYRFEPGRVYNLDATRVLGPGEAIAAAHCDVTRPELAHAAWQAALAASPRPGPPPAPARRARVAAAGPAT